MDENNNPKPQPSTGTHPWIAKLAAGVIGGMIGTVGILNLWPELVPVDKRQILVQESSGVVEVAKRVSPSVVSIVSKAEAVDFFGTRSIEETGAGTGIIIGEDGLILTNKHVVAEGDSFSVFTADGKEYADARVVARDPSNDIAYVRIDAKGLKAAQLGDSSALQVGQRVLAIGNALGRFQNTVTSGIVSGMGRPVVASDASGEETESLDNLIQTDAAINPGNSGGPLVNLDGQVVGINTAVAGGAENIGFAIPINEAKSDIASVKANGKIERAYLGVRYVAVTPALAEANELSVKAGAMVTGGEDGDSGVVAGSPAAKAGIKDGDIIIRVGKDRVGGLNTLASLIARYKPGDTVTITFVRERKERTVKAILEPLPSQL